MGVRGNIGIQRLNHIQKSKRRKIYDRDVSNLPSGYTDFKDHTKMKGHEYAEFQKRQFHLAKLERRKRRIHVLMAIILTAAFLYSLPLIVNLIFS